MASFAQLSFQLHEELSEKYGGPGKMGVPDMPSPQCGWAEGKG